MALAHADFVEETTATTGTGTLTLAGATSGNRTFSSAIGNGNTCIYAIRASNGQYESGIGTVAAGTLARTTLIASSTGSALNLPAGTHTVYCTASADGMAKAYAALQAADIGVSVAAQSHTHSGVYEPVDTNIVRKNVANSFTGAQTFDGGVIITDEVRETPTVANTGDAYTIAIANGTLFDLTLTGNCVFTFPTATAGRQFTLLLKQDATGSRTITWPSAVRWPGGTAPTITATASKTDVISFVADGTYWLGFLAGQVFTRA